MKTKISFIAILAIALNANCVRASECVDDDCDLIQSTEQVVDVLVPMEYEISWADPVYVTETETCVYDYNCPFETDAECEIWYKKPAYKTSVAPRAPHINSIQMDDIIYAVYFNSEVSGNDSVMSPLVMRYKMLMNASDACCTAGILHKMHEKNASDSDIYKFLKNDANYFAVTKRCMVMDNSEFEHRYSNGVTGEMVHQVRNSCLCKNKEWFVSLLQPFNDLYERAPAFQDSAFMYNYVDGLNRNITVSINSEVQTVLDLLESCPE